MDLNPLFTGVTSFRPAVSGGELELFKYADIKLVHGWLVDPSSPEYQAVSQVQDYDTALNLIAEADHISKGQLVTDAQSLSASGQQAVTLTPQESDRVTDGRCHDLLRSRWLILTLHLSNNRPVIPRQHLLTTDLLRSVRHCFRPRTRGAGRAIPQFSLVGVVQVSEPR